MLSLNAISGGRSSGLLTLNLSVLALSVARGTFLSLAFISRVLILRSDIARIISS
jgi:hypothetical protein